MIVDSVDRFFSNCPFRLRDSALQFVLLGRLLLAVEGLLSMLFRLSSSCDVRWATAERVVGGRGLESLFEVASPVFEIAPSFAESSPSSSAADPDDRLRI
jgi:hypothetical protein